MQNLTPTPYAVFATFANTASNVSGTVSASQLSGSVPLAQLPSSVLTKPCAERDGRGNEYDRLTDRAADCAGFRRRFRQHEQRVGIRRGGWTLCLCRKL